jgi:hypothetical protein
MLSETMGELVALKILYSCITTSVETAGGEVSTVTPVITVSYFNSRKSYLHLTKGFS